MPDKSDSLHTRIILENMALGFTVGLKIEWVSERYCNGLQKSWGVLTWGVVWILLEQYEIETCVYLVFISCVSPSKNPQSSDLL